MHLFLQKFNIWAKKSWAIAFLKQIYHLLHFKCTHFFLGGKEDIFTAKKRKETLFSSPLFSSILPLSFISPLFPFSDRRRLSQNPRVEEKDDGALSPSSSFLLPFRLYSRTRCFPVRCTGGKKPAKKGEKRSRKTYLRRRGRRGKITQNVERRFRAKFFRMSRLKRIP